MFIRVYLRVSTVEQSIVRQRQVVDEFCQANNLRPAAYYSESVSGAKNDRPELQRLISDASDGDILLAESVDRVSRMGYTAWVKLKEQLREKNIRMVFCDMPITHTPIKSVTGQIDEMQDRMMCIINEIMIEMMAAYAQKNYLQIRERQRQGIERAKALGVYITAKTQRMVQRKLAVEKLLLDGSYTWSEIEKLTGAKAPTINNVKRKLIQDGKMEKEPRGQQCRKRRLQRLGKEEAIFMENHRQMLREQAEKYGYLLVEIKKNSQPELTAG